MSWVKKLMLNGYPITIIGVSQAGFDGVEPGYSPQIRVPMMMKKELTLRAILQPQRSPWPLCPGVRQTEAGDDSGACQGGPSACVPSDPPNGSAGESIRARDAAYQGTVSEDVDGR